jgi:hypothetical protein
VAKFAYVGENYDNKRGSSAKGYQIRRSCHIVICRWGPIEVHGGGGGKFHWLGSYPRTLRKRFPSATRAEAFVRRMVSAKQTRGYDKLPGRVRIAPARKH